MMLRNPFKRLGMASVASLCFAVALFAGDTSCQAFWGSYGSGGSYGSYASSGSYGSTGSYGSYGGYRRSVRVAYRASYASSGSYGSYGSTGSHGSTGSYASTGSYGSGGSYGVGPVRRLISNIQDNRQAVREARYARRSAASYGSTGSHGSNGSYGSYGSTGGYVSSGSTGSYGSYGGVVETSEPTVYYSEPAESQPTPAEPTMIEPSASLNRSTVKLAVSVPENATVFVNDYKTKSTGAVREFVSHNLSSGSTYTYNLKVQFDRDGQLVTENKSVTLRSGESTVLEFGQGNAAVASSKNIETKLSLSVPADAKVTLAGSPTSQTGEERTFRTSHLADGQAWDDYTVRVELDGEVQERTITLLGGEEQHLSFQFGATQIASL